MKKILLAIALVASLQAFAQEYAAEKKAVEKAEEAAQNPKKATKAQTWLKLGEAYIKAYDAPAGKIWIGASQQEMTYMGLAPQGMEECTIAGQYYQKLIFPDKLVYIGASTGTIAAFEVTKPVVNNALEKALDAYKKAYELEPEKSAKDVKDALQKINVRYNAEGMSLYSLHKMAAASSVFEKSVIVSTTEPYAVLDTNALYNAAFTAAVVPDHERAGRFYQQCYEVGYYGENGHVFSGLAESLMHAGDTTKAVAILEEGFVKYPQSQAIMIGLINYYISKGSGTEKLFALLDKAIENEPDNASLYYVKGNTYVQVKEYDKAVEAYDKCVEVNPSYEFGFIGKGLMYNNLANDAAVKARDEMDDAKYNALVAEFEKNTLACIEPFEKAFEISKDNSIRMTLAEMLKSAYYRFRDNSPEFMASYEKYDKIVKEGL
ncbi:MAG: tetratricopeptide repeat protein [Bacteroidales bacterium]|nr:tetratricopeptide repeat protein [Bacteroidales bacterium]MBR0298206.1 tetratricopeptide repeat protein [Bacteroidales bacterium]